MKFSKLFLGLIICISNLAVGQDIPLVNGKVFNSIFQDLTSGEYFGTVNGLLIIKSNNNEDLILDFQGSESKLTIKPDSNEMYDVSWKTYQGKTTSGKTEIEYQTYGSANSIAVKLNDIWFDFSLIDGACYQVINGLKYSYKTDNLTEYLIIRITNEITLSNWHYLFRTEHTINPNNINTLKPKEKTIKILPESVLIFAIKSQK
jgi:hypothetical protein